MNAKTDTIPAYLVPGMPGEILALNADGECIASRRTYCNPAALRQLICDVESRGWTIDWDESVIANPDTQA